VRFAVRFLVLLVLSPAALSAFENMDAELGLETRFFAEKGLADQDQFHPSLRLEAEYSDQWDSQSAELILFGRYDEQDSERTHFDVREAALTHVGDSFEIKAGVSKVFWGVTESRHLVDIINQTDLVENIDGEDKLGQLMTKLSFEQNWGTLDLFWLPHFRERTFPGEDGRFVSALPGLGVVEIEHDAVQYESGAEEWRSDVAVRYSHYLGDLEFAVSHFSGTSRSPVLVFNNDLGDPKLIPVYKVIDQTGLELQYIYEDWLLKLEAVTSSGPYDRYTAAVAGFEFTQYGIWESQADLGWIVEYLFDDSKESELLHTFERDIFAGWRYAFNDEDSSEILLGAIYDPKSEEILYSFEASKRLASDLKVNAEVRVFDGADTQDSSNATWFLQDEDLLQLELVKYF